MGESVSAEVLAALDRGVHILTANERSARATRLAWDRRQASSGKKSWEPASVFSWLSWTHHLWRRLTLTGRVTSLLLSPLQERRVWSRVISTGSLPAGPQRLRSQADLAAKTWRQLCAYEGVDRLERTPHLQGDFLQFARWIISFKAICDREQLLSDALLESELAHHLTKGDLDEWGGDFLLLGFHRMLPSAVSLLQHCRSHGFSFESAEVLSSVEGTLVLAADEIDELRGCARWVRDQVREHADTRIALVVDDLERSMADIDSLLREHLSPETEDITVNKLPGYEFSLGRSLAHEPMVQCALDLLRWIEAPLPIESVSRLLLSPHFAENAREAAVRAEFDYARLKATLRLWPEVTIRALLTELRDHSAGKSRLPVFRHVLEALDYAQTQHVSRRRAFGDWSERFRGWLNRAQWCATGPALSSREYQVRERWEGALDDLASLDFLGETVSFSEALSNLESIVEERIFAPQSRGTRVQVLGPLEVGGERFDAVWVLRAGESTWPPESASLPLLPKSLQRELGMPGTDRARDRETSQLLTRRLAASAAQVVFSFAQAVPGVGHQRAASVVRELDLTNASMPDFTAAPTQNSPVALERISDESLIAPLESGKHRGGARVLELQAACGFRAFAELRLWCSERRSRADGMNAMERGNLVHTALERFWGKVGSQNALRAMSRVQRDEVLVNSVSETFKAADGLQANRWDAAYLDVQKERLVSRLTEWLATEARRPSFDVVAHESRQSVSVGPLQLSVRVDRVDLVDGRKVILDYKTGLAQTSEWLGERPDKPQVPLYAILAATSAPEQDGDPSSLGAVGFAQIRAGEGSKLCGFEAQAGTLFTPGSRGANAKMDAESFSDQVSSWNDVLSRLATEFATGDASIRPKKYPSTCERCGQRLLCRVDGSRFESDMDEALPEQDEALNG